MGVSAKKKLGGLAGVLAAIAAAVLATRGGGAPRPPAAPVPAPAPTLAVMVRVFEAPAAADHKVPGARVTLAGKQLEADGAGNATFAGLAPGAVEACVEADGYVRRCVDGSVPAASIDVELERAVPPVSAVRLEGDTLRLVEGGRPWVWRYATAFVILARSDAEQEAFLEWAQARGFNGVRVLTTAVLLTDLPPDVGRARLPAFLEKLARRGMGAELVALADTKARGMSRAAMREHVSGVAAIVAAASVPLTIELANENAHPTQQADLQDVGFLRELRGLVPAHMPVSLGSSCCDQADTVEHYAGGDYSTPHLDRGRPLWQEVARVKHLIEDFRGYVVDDEAIGAAEADDPGRRSARPERFFAQAVLDRLGGVGSTFHFDAGLRAELPGPVADDCARAFVEGATLVPDVDTFRFVNDSGADGVTRGADWSRVFKLFAFVNRDASRPSYVVALGVSGELAATYVNGWHPVRVVASRPGIQVIEVSR